MRPIAICVLLAGCVTSPMLVHDVTIDGYDLVIERCPARGISSCDITREPLPVALHAAPKAPMRPTPDRVHDAAMLAKAHDELAACGLHGRIELDVDPRGQAHGARVDGEANDCIAQAVSSVQFEPGRERVVAFVWAEVAP